MSTSVFCAFCEREFQSSEQMMEHLLMCGNKTDPCPNCRKYVRRAIFAYHYENDCADPDAPSTEGDDTQKTTQSEKPLVSVKCTYCQDNYDQKDMKTHKKHCPSNPANQKSSNGRDSNQTLDRSHQSNENEDEVRVPCEWCNEAIPWDRFQNHTEACRDKEHKRLEENLRRNSQQPTPTPVYTSVPASSNSSTVTIKTPSPTDTAPCRFCGKNMSLIGIAFHQLICVKNPKRNKSQAP